MPNFGQNMAGASPGFLQALMAQQQAQQRQQQSQQQQELFQRRQAARQLAGQALMDQAGQMPQPPAPGQSSAPPGAGGGGPPGGAPQGQPAEFPPPPPPQGWQPPPNAAPAGAAPGSGPAPQIGAPPAAAVTPAGAPGAGQQPGVTPQRQFDLKSILQTLTKQGVPPDRVMDMLDEMAPIMSAQNKVELDNLKTAHSLQQDVLRYTQERVRELQGQQRLDIAKGEAESRQQDRQTRARQRDETNARLQKSLEAKLYGSVGGKDNLKRTDFEKDADGNIIGIVGITKSGKIIRKGMQGEDRVDSPSSGPKADSNRLRQVNSWRSELSTLIGENNPKNRARIEDLKSKIAGADKPSSAGAASKPKPTDSDRAWAKAHPEDAAKFKAHFGVEP